MLPARTCRASPESRAPAAALRLCSAPRLRPRVAPLQISPSAPGGLALALTSPKRHMSSLGLRNVPLPRRPVEAARLSPNAGPPAPLSPGEGHGGYCLNRFREDHVSAEVACGHWKHIWSPSPGITTSHLLGQRRKGVETGSSVCNLGGCQVGWPAIFSHSCQKETGAREPLSFNSRIVIIAGSYNETLSQ